MDFQASGAGNRKCLSVAVVDMPPNLYGCAPYRVTRTLKLPVGLHGEHQTCRTIMYCTVVPGVPDWIRVAGERPAKSGVGRLSESGA